MGTEGLVFDIEGNGLLPSLTRLWNLCAKDLNSEDEDSELLISASLKNTRIDFRGKFLEYINQFDKPIITGHFILGYDLLALLKLLNIKFTVNSKGYSYLGGREVIFIDTLYLSQFLNPDRPAHGLDSYGKQLYYPKMDLTQELDDLGFLKSKTKDDKKEETFKRFHPLMDTYCRRDVSLNKKVYHLLVSKFEKLYGCHPSESSLFLRAQKNFFLMICQELSGWRFDQEFALDVKKRLEEDIKLIEDQVEPHLPPRELLKGEIKEYVAPVKCFKQNGELSAYGEKFKEKHSLEEVYIDEERFFKDTYGNTFKLIGGESIPLPNTPMKLKDQEQLKQWFMDQGWKPLYWNIKKKDGKPVRDAYGKMIRTTPKFHDKGILCPNLEGMDTPLVSKAVKWLSLSNRLGVLKGWLSNPRLARDGRIGAGMTAIAVTHRQKHSTVVNVPKASDKVLYGKDFRKLWIAREGYVIVGCDAAAIEGRVQGHEVYHIDQGETARELLEGDVHSKNVVAFYGSIEPWLADFLAKEDFDKEDSVWVPYRNKSKNGLYATMYGARAPMLAITLGISLKQAEEALEAFWEANPATKQRMEELETEWIGSGKKYIKALDGRYLVVRKQSSILNTKFQSGGAIIMDMALLLLDHKFGGIHVDRDLIPCYHYKGHKIYRIGYFHDEYEFEVPEEIALEIKVILEWAIKRAGEILKMKIPLVGEGKIGANWAEVH